jgi:hypothetical protein
MAQAVTVLEVPATALTNALRSSPRSLTRCSRHGRPADVHVDINILAPAKPKRRLYRASAFSYLEDTLELLTGARARTPVTAWPLCAHCWRHGRWGRVLTRTLFVAGLVSLLSGLGVGLALRLSTGQYAPTWVLAPILLGFAMMPLAGVPATIAHPNRIIRAETTRDGATVRFTDPHPAFADQLRALLGSQVRRSDSPGQPVTG